MNKKNEKIFLILGIIILIFIGLENIVKAEKERILWISWKADNYAPYDYFGKNLPAIGTPIETSLMILENGVIQDISSKNIWWFLNSKPITSGIGKIKVAFKAERENKIEAKIYDYEGGIIKETIYIPIANPSVVIKREDNSIFKALPYFFNAKKDDLEFKWLVNENIVTSENIISEPDYLKLITDEVVGNLKMNIKVFVLNKEADEQASAIKSIELNK